MIPRIPRFTSALLLIAVALFAEAQQTKEAKSRSSISGTVVDSSDGAPIKGVNVFLSGEVKLEQNAEGTRREYSTRSTPLGIFAFENIEPGQYWLSVRKPGYSGMRTRDLRHPADGVRVTLSEDQQFTGLELQLVPSATIIGRVVDEEGSPLAGLRVEARQWTFQNGKRILESGGGDSTNDLGEFRIWGLLPGRFYLVIPVIWAPASPAGRLIKTYYPNARNIDDATPIVLGPGEQFQADFSMIHVPCVRVRGSLSGVAPDGSHGGFFVQLNAEERGAVPIHIGVRPDNTFEEECVTPGTYEVVVSGFDYGEIAGPERELARSRIEVPASGLDTLTIPVPLSGSKKGELFGTVTSVEKDFRPGGFFVLLERINTEPDDEEDFLRQHNFGPVKSDGTFKMNPPEAGSYYVQMSKGGFGVFDDEWYIQSIEYNGRDFTNKPIVFPASASGTLRITMSSKSAVLEGTVADHEGKALAQAQVMLLPSDGSKRPDLYQTAQSDQNGRFKMRGIVPGSYTVIALSDADSDAAADPNFLKTAASRGTSVRFEAGDRQAVALKIASDISPQ